MEDALCRFDPFNDVFILRWAGRKGKAKVNALRRELVKKQNVYNETNA